MPVVALTALAFAHLFDLTSFLVMTGRHGMQAEANPVVVAIVQDFGLPGVTLAKIASVVILALAVFALSKRRRNVAMVVLMLGICAGVLGGISNIAST